MNTNHDRKPGTARHTAKWPLAVGAAITATLLTGCQGGQRISLGDQASTYNHEILNMGIWAIVISLVIFLGVSAGLFYTVHKFREENNQNAPQQFHGNNRLETALVFIPTLIVILLSILAVRTMARVNPVSQQSLSVEALAKQFWWNFSYPSAKVTGGVVANGNEMIVPIKQTIAVTTTSADVVHGFWAPNLGGQRAAIPGSQKTWNIGTEREGVYQGNCTQLCGSSHANMRFKVVALPQNRFDTFIKDAVAYTAPAPAAGSAEERGMNVFMKGTATAPMACAACHRVQGTPAAGVTGPDLSFFGTRRTLGAGMWEAMTADHWMAPDAAAHLHAWIKHSPVVKPGSLMPRYDGGEYMDKGKMIKGGTLSDQEIDDVAAYLRSLKLPDEADYWAGIPINGTGKIAGGTK